MKCARVAFRDEPERWPLVQSLRHPRERVTRVRGTFAGWTETVLFDFDGKPIGIELPLTDEERDRLLQHPQVRRFVEAGSVSSS